MFGASASTCYKENLMSLARARNLTVLPFATLLAVALTVSPVHVRGSSSASGIAVAGGTVTSASGAAMAGQTVDLYAWPSDAVQKAMKPGQRVPTTLLAKATTSRTGTYMLRVPAAKLKAAAVESGYANLEIFSAAGGFRFFPYQTGSLPAHPSALVTFDLSSKKGPVCGKSIRGFTLFSVRPNHEPISNFDAGSRDIEVRRRCRIQHLR